MSERGRLIKWLGCKYNCADRNKCLEEQADYLLEKGVIVPSCNRVYFIVNKGTRYEYVSSMGIDALRLYEIKDLLKYGFYTTKEQAEKALKGGATNE